MEEQGSNLPLGGIVRRKAEQQAEERQRGIGRIREAFRGRDADEEASRRRWRIDVAPKRTGE